jgi:hypothetical protein
MAKLVRNSIFTVIAVVLTAVGVGWNRRVMKDKDPVSIGQTVLADQPALAASSQTTIPLEVSFAHPVIKLGQTQELIVKTQPRAELKIVTIYPNGSINNPQTLTATADDVGQYSLKYKLADFHYLGTFQTVVEATVGGQTVEGRASFVLQTWIQTSDAPDSGYVYPLVP